MNKELVAENTLFLMKRLAISFDEAWDNHTSDNIKSACDKEEIRSYVNSLS